MPPMAAGSCALSGLNLPSENRSFSGQVQELDRLVKATAYSSPKPPAPAHGD
jgi:hypothetical protein